MTTRDRISQLVDDAISSNRSKGADVVREAIIDAIDKNFELKLAHTIAIELFTQMIDAHTQGKVTDPGRYTITVNADGTVTSGDFAPAGSEDDDKAEDTGSTGGPAPFTGDAIDAATAARGVPGTLPPLPPSTGGPLDRPGQTVADQRVAPGAVDASNSASDTAAKLRATDDAAAAGGPAPVSDTKPASGADFGA